MLPIVALFLAALAPRGAHGATPAATDQKSCCTTISLRATLFAVATAAANAAGADGEKQRTYAPNVSTKGWPAKPWPDGMVWIPGGEFWTGSDEPDFADARPWHRVYVDGFWMDATEVTNEQVEKFVKATSKSWS